MLVHISRLNRQLQHRIFSFAIFVLSICDLLKKQICSLKRIGIFFFISGRNDITYITIRQGE